MRIKIRLLRLKVAFLALLVALCTVVTVPLRPKPPLPIHLLVTALCVKTALYALITSISISKPSDALPKTRRGYRQMTFLCHL
ncbi:hypothetical protein AURDEDRAFT_168084 [Auricularia subglabra TFB-10046 SS5]|nr:hypothetical protein AURDEDRAFT_168084 [Auricularia subglabra TFB-10046 SS5]